MDLAYAYVEFVLSFTCRYKVVQLVYGPNHLSCSIQQALWNANIKHIRIDGSVPSADRNLLVKQFQSDPKTKVAILSILAAGTVCIYSA